MDAVYTTPYVLSKIRTKKLKSLYYDSRSIRLLAILWLIFGFLMLMVIPGIHMAKPEIPMQNKIIFSVFCLAMAAFFTVTAIGVFRQCQWARICGIVLCVLSLGILLGALGLIAFLRSPELFGPDHLNRSELKAEYKHRRMAKRNSRFSHPKPSAYRKDSKEDYLIA